MNTAELQAADADLLKALDDGQKEIDQLLKAIKNAPQPLIPGEATYDRLQRIDHRASRIRHARHYLELSFLMAKEAVKG